MDALHALLILIGIRPPSLAARERAAAESTEKLRCARAKAEALARAPGEATQSKPQGSR